jgi:hypothetical protein
MICALLHPEEKGSTLFEMCAITCPVTKSHIPSHKYLEKLHDLKMFLQAISFKIPRDFIKFYISSIDSRNFQGYTKNIWFYIDLKTLKILWQSCPSHAIKAYRTACIDTPIFKIKTQWL